MARIRGGEGLSAAEANERIREAVRVVAPPPAIGVIGQAALEEGC